jgi:uncharacterized membrane protein HdeD (DUF308 family)
MTNSAMLSKWWIMLIQGIFMVVLSIIILSNPEAVLTAIAFWLGIVVIVTGVIGVLAYFANEKKLRDSSTLYGSIAILIIGILMVSKVFVTMKAITILFGMLVIIVGMVLLAGSWNERLKWSLWWVIALIGAITISLGIKSIMDINSGAESIGILIGISVLFSGIGTILLAFLKKKILMAIRSKK